MLGEISCKYRSKLFLFQQKSACLLLRLGWHQIKGGANYQTRPPAAVNSRDWWVCTVAHHPTVKDSPRLHVRDLRPIRVGGENWRGYRKDFFTHRISEHWRGYRGDFLCTHGGYGQGYGGSIAMLQSSVYIHYPDTYKSQLSDSLFPPLHHTKTIIKMYPAKYLSFQSPVQSNVGSEVIKRVTHSS